MMMNALLCLLWLSCLPAIVFNKQLSNKDVHDIRRFISHVMQCRGVPGLSVALVETNRTVLTEGMGLADVETEQPATENSLFCVASLTKAFTVTLLGKLLHKHG